MGRKRLNKSDKKTTFHLNVTQKVIDEFKKDAEEKGEVPSHIIEDLIKKYLNK